MRDSAHTTSNRTESITHTQRTAGPHQRAHLPRVHRACDAPVQDLLELRCVLWLGIDGFGGFYFVCLLRQTLYQHLDKRTHHRPSALRALLGIRTP